MALYKSAPDEWTKSRLAGLVAVEAAWCFEVSIKRAVLDFCQKRDLVFGSFMENRYRNMSGRIKTADIQTEFLERFGDKYRTAFAQSLDAIRQAAQKANRDDPTNRYNVLIETRHNFVHTGSLNLTFNETIEYFEDACLVIEALEKTLT